MLIALIQGIVRAFDKNLGPFDQGSGEKGGESTDQDFLKEGGVHPIFGSNEGASQLVKMPRGNRHEICGF